MIPYNISEEGKRENVLVGANIAMMKLYNQKQLRMEERGYVVC